MTTTRPDEDVLATAVAAGVGAIAAGRGLPGLAASGSSTGRSPARTLGDVADMELLLPRWRRPSLLQARKADPIRDTTPAPRLTFDAGLVGPLDGRERRVIRYRVVRLLDSPDELRGAEIGYLDQGDEVQLLEKYGAYWLVLSPDGQQGWLHKMTLGDVVAGRGAGAGRPDRDDADRRRDLDDGRVGRRQRRLRGLPRVAPPREADAPRSLRSTRMCWWTMFGTKARG